MAIPLFFQTIEQTRLSTWLRDTDSIFGFYFILLFHTFGLSFLVGTNAVIDLRILGVASSIPLKSLKGLFAIMWTGLGINVTTGLLLLTSYPTKAFTNPYFYSKMTFVALGVITAIRLYKRVFADASLSEAAMLATGKPIARFSLAIWFVAIANGRLLSDSARYLTYGHRILS